jgi:hypothetical protein
MQVSQVVSHLYLEYLVTVSSSWAIRQRAASSCSSSGMYGADSGWAEGKPCLSASAPWGCMPSDQWLQCGGHGECSDTAPRLPA